MKKKVYKQSAECAQFYNAIKQYASVKFNVSADEVGVIGNSMNYPDSVAIPTDFMAGYTVAGFARYDKTGKTVNQYAVKMDELMKVLDKFYRAGGTMMCGKKVDGVDCMCRLPWSYLESFELSLKNSPEKYINL